MPEWFDSHCHLHLCEGSAADVVAEARAQGVVGILAVGLEVESSVRALEIARELDLCCTAGVHPNSAPEWNDEAAFAIDGLLADERVVAVGETGLDFYRDHCAPEVQRPAFEAHVGLAKRHDKALIIHTRESIAEACSMLEELGPPARLVFHCWSDSLDELHRALDLGALVSFAGNVSFKKAGDLRKAAAVVPGDRLLVETDSPYLSPEPHRGKPNRPANIAHVGAAVAVARKAETEEIARLTTANARRLYGV